MNYAKINAHDIANGPGVRVSVFVSGCRRHCHGCHNPQAWDFGYGEPFTGDTVDKIIELLEPDYISGITILGGEPFDEENAAVVSELLRKVWSVYKYRKSTWVYTGYRYEEIIEKTLPGDAWNDLMLFTDVLVDGPYIEAERDISLAFRGSRNQRIIDIPKSLCTGGIALYEV